jgi:hypothetical protein
MKSILLLLVWCLAGAIQIQAGVQLNVSRQESHDTLAASSTVSSGENAKFSCGRILLLSPNDQSILQRIVEKLRPLIAQLPQVHEITQGAVPSATSKTPFLPDGTRGPDLFLCLELLRSQEQGWWTRSLEATVHAHLGTAPWESHHSVMDETTPPLISYGWSGNLQHHGQVRGFEFPKYQAAITDMACQLAHAVTNEILKQLNEYGALPPLPDKLYGPYRPTPDLPFPPDLKPERLCSYYGLLTHNETFWRTPELTNPAPALKAFEQQLKAAHWRIDTLELSNAPRYYLRATLDRASLELFNLNYAGLIA